MKMKALQQLKYGEISDSVGFSEIQKPILKKDEVLIETRAASVNPLDNKIVKGDLKAVRKYTFPVTMGHDISGVIVAIGDDVTDFKIGDEVYAFLSRQGSFSEFATVSQSLLSLKPKNTSFEEAASLPLVGLTVSQAFKRGKLKPGEKILIHAGSGGVGSLAIQMAKAMGAIVYTTTSTSNVKWVKELGADRVIDYKKEEYKSTIKDVDMVFDTLGGEFTNDAFDVIKRGGRIISLVGPIDAETAGRMKLNFFAKLFLKWKRRNITKQIKRKSAFYSLVFMRANIKQLNDLTTLVETGKVKASIDQIFPFDEAINAILHVEKGRTKGKVVIKM